MVLQENIFIIYQRLEAVESALILTITTCFVGPTNFESSSIHNYCYTVPVCISLINFLNYSSYCVETFMSC